MDIKSRFETDETMETLGIPIKMDDKTTLYIARWGNPRYQAMFQELTRPYRSAIEAGTIDEGLSRQLMTKVIAHTVLVGWDNLQEDGEEVIYSHQEAERILTQYKDFRSYVIRVASDMENFKAHKDEVTEKN